MDRHVISGPGLRAVIKENGAELCSLRNDNGTEFLWQAGAAWTRHAPNLFPIVGRLKNDTLRHKGREYRMTQHGFARDSIFTWEEKNASSCRLSLRDNETTRAIYPFSFLFEVIYAVENNTLSVTYRIENTGNETLPASVGAHPAFQWPLPGNLSKDSHTLEFSNPETAPTRRVSGGLLLTETFPNPVEGKILPLNEELFAADAVIMDKPASNKVRYSAPGVAGIEISWNKSFPQLGIWSKAGADLLCIEPWHGMASPVDFDGEITAKPGIMLIAPGDRRETTFRISLPI